MIYIHLNTDEFEPDVRAMVKAFYPEHEQYAYCDKSKVQQQKRPEINPDFTIEVSMGEETLSVVWQGDGKRTAKAGRTCRMERKARRNDLKKALYALLSEETGKKLPWGTLTGIRPTKLFVKALEEGTDEKRLKWQMMEDYLIDERKFLTGLAIAKKERQLLQGLPGKDGFSLYIHIPFCPTTCLYCSFTSFPGAAWEVHMDAYVEALKKELLLISELTRGLTLATVYVGGGTPTTLSDKQLYSLLSFVREHFSFEKGKEFTVEAGRPDSITKEKLQVLKKCGVNRISINPQTMNEKTLRVLGRQHTVEQTRKAFALARQEEFENINMDIILGLPGEGIDEVGVTLNEIKELEPDNLTVHCLAVKHNSRLNFNMEEYRHALYTDVTQVMELAQSAAEEMGMEPYYLYRQKQIAGNQENVGYAFAGKEGLYNILIMEEVHSIFSAGAGAVTKLVKTPGELYKRVENVKDVTTYLNRTQEMIDKKRKAILEMGL